MVELFLKMATIFLNSTNRDWMYTPESFKIELFGEKVLSHKIICIFGSGLTVCTFKSCQSVKKVSRSWAMTLL